MFTGSTLKLCLGTETTKYKAMAQPSYQTISYLKCTDVQPGSGTPVKSNENPSQYSLTLGMMVHIYTIRTQEAKKRWIR